MLIIKVPFRYFEDEIFEIFLFFLLQLKLERAEWGTDLPSVETQLENQRQVHTSVEELSSSLREARSYEVGVYKCIPSPHIYVITESQVISYPLVCTVVGHLLTHWRVHLRGFSCDEDKPV